MRGCFTQRIAGAGTMLECGGSGVVGSEEMGRSQAMVLLRAGD